MRYRDATAFRAALETRLNRMAVGARSNALVRLRRLVAFDRLLTRMVVVAPNSWLVKGGVALDLRLGERARHTRDLDLERYDSEEDATNDLLTAAGTPVDDYFEFAIERGTKLAAIEDAQVVRYQMSVSLAGHRFERIRIDVGLANASHVQPDRLRLPDLLAFAEIFPVEIPALPLEFHVAEKLHAYTRRYSNDRPSTRVKDLIDLVLIRTTSRFGAAYLRRAIVFAFESRGRQAIPSELPPPPQNWTATYRALANEVGLDPEIAVGYRLVTEFLNPLLSGEISDSCQWQPVPGSWLLPQDG